MKNKILNLIAGVALLILGCSPKMHNIVSYDSNYDNSKRIEKEIKKQRVKLTLSGEFTSGKGFFKIRDSANKNGEEATFTIVRHEILEDGRIMITNEVPTNEGLFELRILVKENVHLTDFKIVESWQKSIDFDTISSYVRMNKKINSNGITHVEIKYKGIQIENGRSMELSSEFYVQIK